MAHGFSSIEESAHVYLCVTHSELLRIDINVIQDDLRRLLRVDRLFDKMGAEDFVSGGRNRSLRSKWL
jgi:hypothetical protein